MSASGEDGSTRRDFLPEEDTVEYRLYSPKEEDEGPLAKMAAECTQHARHITRDHIWHYDSFSLEVCAGKRGTYPPHIYGSTCFRDNVEDEWLVVYLLYSISRLYPQLVIRVWDSDGQFLLVEAAHKLPRWLTPETEANRVFIHRGQLHIIPKPRSPAELTTLPVSSPTVRDAVRIVSDEGVSTVAEQPIQRCIQERIEKFSDDLGSHLHYAHCYVPVPVAHVMSHDPQLVSAAVHSLCDRDPIDMHACRKMNYFSPRKCSSVMTGIKFTRCLYAQLLNQRFNCPRNSGFYMPPAGDRRHAACDMGMKLTCGLEILLSRVKSGEVKMAKGDESSASSYEDDPRWLRFLKSLESKGFFRGEVEGSLLHQQLLSSAKEYFVGHLQDDKEGPPLNVLSLAGRRALHILQDVPFSEEELIEKSKKLNPPNDDSWMEISPGELDAMMKQAAGYLPQDDGVPSSARQGAKVSPPGEGSAELDLQSMVFGMKSFVEKVSSHEGAEMPWTGKTDEEVNFDPESVMDVMRAMLDSASFTKETEEEETVDIFDTDDLSISDDSEEEEDEREINGESEAGRREDGCSKGDEEMEEVMAAMDREIGVTEVGKSFEKMKVDEETEEVGGVLQPVDVDFNLVKNLLESYSSQEGVAGPASNILQSLGIHIPEQEREL